MTVAAVKSRPIIMSAESVRAILDKRKTQTRRVIKNPQRLDGLMLDGEEAAWCPYGGPEDLLWVKETWGQYGPMAGSGLFYRADGHEPPHIKNLGGWRNSLFMPKRAARLWLRVVKVKVERVQEISDEDALAEGVPSIDNGNPTNAFPVMWDMLNAKRGYSWDSNPWVWVIEFAAHTEPAG